MAVRAQSTSFPKTGLRSRKILPIAILVLAFLYPFIDEALGIGDLRGAARRADIAIARRLSCDRDPRVRRDCAELFPARRQDYGRNTGTQSDCQANHQLSRQSRFKPQCGESTRLVLPDFDCVA